MSLRTAAAAALAAAAAILETGAGRLGRRPQHRCAGHVPPSPPPLRDPTLDELAGWQRALVDRLAGQIHELGPGHAANGRILADLLRFQSRRRDTELARHVLIVLDFARETARANPDRADAFAALYGALSVASVDLTALDRATV